MKITSKGQVTIPQGIRERAGLLPHTDVEFELVDGAVILRKAAGDESRGRRLVAGMRGRGTVSMTTDEIMALMRQGDDALDE